MNIQRIYEQFKVKNDAFPKMIHTPDIKFIFLSSQSVNDSVSQGQSDDNYRIRTASHIKISATQRAGFEPARAEPI